MSERQGAGMLLAGIAAGVLATVALVGSGAAQDAEESRTPFEVVSGALEGEGARDKVIFGKEARPGAYPFQVSMIVSRVAEGEEFSGHFCGGTLISDTVVLTAAHCVTFQGSLLGPQEIDVYVGSVNFRNGDRIKIADIVRHPGYDARHLENDIAILKLERAPRAGVSYAVIKLTDVAGESQAARPGAPVSVIGWGRTENGKPSPVLREAEIQVVDQAQCNANYLMVRGQRLEGQLASSFKIEAGKIAGLRDQVLRNAGRIVTDGMICAGNPRPDMGARRVNDACNGDSGGPLFTRATDGSFLQVGVVSWGDISGCGLPYLYGVYTRLSKYTSWIAAVTGPQARP